MCGTEQRTHADVLLAMMWQAGVVLSSVVATLLIVQAHMLMLMLMKLFQASDGVAL